MITAVLADATTSAELDAVMRALVAAGTRCTYLEACYHVAPALRAEVSGYFGDDGLLREPERTPANSFMAGGSFISLSALVEAFHDRLRSVLTDTPVPVAVNGGSVANVAETGSEAVDIAFADPVVDEPVHAPDLRFLCPICDKRVDAEPVVFRGTAMCPRCVGKLRGF